jgi:hypothetical protein
VNPTHDNGDDSESHDEEGPFSGTGDDGKGGDGTAHVDPAARTENSTADRDGSEAGAADAHRGPRAQAGHGSGTKSPSASRSHRRRKRQSTARRRWDQWSKKTRAFVAVVITSVVSAVAAAWILVVAGPHTPTAPTPTPIGNPGHAPGRHDVSTMSRGHRFYAVANFYYFRSCGRPCWLPLYQLPTEKKSAGLTDGWPCEYYEPGSAPNGPYCLHPPAGRTPSEMANPRHKYSGDRVLVVCQTTRIDKQRVAQTIHNEAVQASNIWDMVAVPRSYISPNGVVAGRLRQVPGMPGFYEAYAPDIWLGNTGWHSIPCK